MHNRIAHPFVVLPVAALAAALFAWTSLDGAVAADGRAGGEDFSRYGLFAATAPRAAECAPATTSLPLELRRGDRICLIGNTLFERAQLFGQVSAILQAGFSDHELVVRNIAWSADEIDLTPRPDNFADIEHHLVHLEADVILAAYGFNESFAGPAGLPAFREKLAAFLGSLQRKAFNGKAAPRIVLVSPIPNENVAGVAAADLNNGRIQGYVAAMRDVAREQGVGFVDLFEPLRAALADPATDLTINGCHLTDRGYDLLAQTLFRGCFAAEPPAVSEELRQAVVDLDRQFFRRYRPLNTFYYTGGRNKEYGYLDFLPAMRSFDIMCATRDRRIWDIAHGRPVAEKPDDSNLPEMPPVKESRGANEWLPAAKEREAFRVDPRFEVNLFAGEEQFPEIANPIQCRWDSRGRMWVSTSQAYPHVYPGMESRDRLVILEDVDGDGRADTSKVFADDLHLPLSFEFGDGGVYVSEQPHLTFLEDTDGDDRADVHEVVLSGFGTEDSHHSLHDFIWAPDGGLIFRESVFHHTQVETPYGPVRQQNSGWFHYQPRTHRLVSFGSYPSTNPWGVAYDRWGNHVASHPVFAEAFHVLDPPYPRQFPAPQGLQAYSGVCGQAFIDSPGFPEDLQGSFVRVRYKPTNRVEIHRWIEGSSGFDERYVGDLIFSTNLSFIPVDCHFGPRGELFVVDWYNPVKGHLQYSLRDSRRDRESGRLWRITAKGQKPAALPAIAGASEAELARLLGHGEFRVRYLATRELTTRDRSRAADAIDAWLAALDPASPRLLRDKTEAMWALSAIGVVRPALLVELASAADHHARVAAVRQLRFWHESLPDRHDLLDRAACDPSGLVRLEAALTASWIGTPEALAAVLEVCRQPLDGHLAYAATCALESRTLRPYWENAPASPVPGILRKASRSLKIVEPKPTAAERSFDRQPGLSEVRVSCEPERMLFTNRLFAVTPGQPVKLVFTNPDATDHNLVVVKPGALAEVGMAANGMAKDPKNATGDFVPESKRDLIIAATPMIGPTRTSLAHVLRFEAPTEPGVYPYVCTFPGHWIVMNGQMVVAKDAAEAEELLAACKPTIVKAWTLDDFPTVSTSRDEAALTRGMHAFAKAQCTQCHVAAGHGVNLGPSLVESVKKYRGRELLEQIIDPSKSIHEKYRTMQFLLESGRVVSGVVLAETPAAYRVATNLLAPDQVTVVKKDEIDEQTPGKVSAMPAGLLNVLTRDEVVDLISFVEAGDDLPSSLRHAPAHPAPASLPARRPNILYIIVDDQSPFDFKFYEPSSTLHAPVLERLAAEGMVFDAAYHMGSFVGGVCTPSRHMVMSGRTVWHLPIGPGMSKRKRVVTAAGEAPHCPPGLERFTMAPVFQAAGYDTMRTCKVGNAYEAADALFAIRRDASKRGGTAETGSAWHGDQVMAYLEERERSKDADPFLIYFGFSHPHDTRDGTPELLAKYGATNHADEQSLPPADPRQPPLPPNWLPRHPFDHGHMDVRDEVAASGVWKNRDERTIRNERGREYACSENIDRQIGRVLDKLAAMGELDNTWIFYTSDHGIAIGRHGFQGKQNLYEHSWRVPFIVKGPGVKPGSRAPGNIYLGDTLATLCDICGIEPPETNEGRSFLPVLEGQAPTVRDVLYGVYCGGQKPGMRSVRQGGWKLIKYESPSGGLHTQLFNLVDNPHEFLAEHHDPEVARALPAAAAAHQKNLADDPTHAVKRAEMEALLLAEMIRHDDPFRFSDQPAKQSSE
jgi:putative heme-binding domain-containing protein